jgi:hypothetical protein
LVPATHRPFAQQPPLHGDEALHAVPHVCVELSQAKPAGQSSALTQPHCPLGMHAGDGMAQATQLTPEPQAAAVLPGRQLPPEQQPELHRWVALHWGAPQWPPVGAAMHTSSLGSQLAQKPPPAPQLKTLLPPVPAVHALVLGSQQPSLQSVCAASPQPASQTWVTVLQAESSGQSAATLQPQPRPATHNFPDADVEQSRQTPLGATHAVLALPAMQLSVAGSQQPPLQPLTNGAQLPVHRPPAQASSEGQSPADTQPQVWPPPATTHRWPADGLLQSAQAAPVEPQAPVSAPATQLPAAEQQPPLHGCDAEQVVTQACVKLSQALPGGQSAAEPQPQCEPKRQAGPAAAPEQSTQTAEAPHAPALLPL